jgi:hypothetical protein
MFTPLGDEARSRHGEGAGRHSLIVQPELHENGSLFVDAVEIGPLASFLKSYAFVKLPGDRIRLPDFQESLFRPSLHGDIETVQEQGAPDSTASIGRMYRKVEDLRLAGHNPQTNITRRGPVPLGLGGQCC